VLPRYQDDRSHGGIEVVDAGWPGPPSLGQAVTLDDDQRTALRVWLLGHWPTSTGPNLPRSAD